MLLKWNALFRYHSCQTHSQHLYSKAVSPPRSLASITGKEHNNAVFGWSSRLVWAAASADRLTVRRQVPLWWRVWADHQVLVFSTVVSMVPLFSFPAALSRTKQPLQQTAFCLHHIICYIYIWHLSDFIFILYWFQWACCKMQPGAPQTVFFAALVFAAAAGKILAVISSAGKNPEQIKLSIMCLATFTYLYLPVFCI